MAIKTKRYISTSLASFVLATLFSVGTVNAQTMPPTQRPPVADPPPRTFDNDDITHREIADMDRFLDKHPEIAEQLRRDPSLIDNRQWVSSHPALQDYLKEHPQVSEAFRTDPNAFMHDENRYDQREGDRDRDRDRDRDNISRRDVVDMDRFLDKHPELAEQLRKDPSLIDNKQWVSNHPALQDYLKEHPQVSEAFRTDPNAFMKDENRYDQRENDRDRFARGGDRDNRELTSFGQFLGNHTSMSTELAKDPSLANNKEYLATHPELQSYLQAHPAMTQQLSENPQAVMSSNWVQQSGNNMGAKNPTPKTKPNPNE